MGVGSLLNSGDDEGTTIGGVLVVAGLGCAWHASNVMAIHTTAMAVPKVETGESAGLRANETLARLGLQMIFVNLPIPSDPQVVSIVFSHRAAQSGHQAPLPALKIKFDQARAGGEPEKPV